jgi:putative ABC transport system permease protein
MAIPLAWLQLTREKRRLVAAVAGIAFAAMLMLMQLGFRDALLTSSTRFHECIEGDIVIISPLYQYIVFSKPFTVRRLHQALALENVESVAPLYIGITNWMSPDTHLERSVLVLAVDPNASALALPGVTENLGKIQALDTVLFDVKSRREFGPIEEQFLKNGAAITEVTGRRIEVTGLFQIGSSFGTNGNIITSDLTFFRLFPYRKSGLIDVGVIKLKPGADPEKTRAQLSELLPKDVKVLTRQKFIDLEHQYWEQNSPVGFIFTLGALMGFIVGAVIVYQILYTDVSDHLQEYATLKAMGYGDRYLLSIVLQEALILSVLGFIPGSLIAEGIYNVARNATNLPMTMTLSRMVTVFLLGVVMCLFSGALAMRRLKAADPADIF